jgi:hypothetical protein
MSIKRGPQEVPVVTTGELQRGVDPHEADHGEISSTTQEELDNANARREETHPGTASER